MTDQQKIQLVDRLMEQISAMSTQEDIPVMVGTLNQPQGIKGFERAEIGHPVFETKDRYVIYLTGPVNKAAVPYYKDTLKPFIDFTE